jgi:two-component system chemotaxis sensor kinase CheA
MSDYLDPNNEELLKDFFIEAQSQVDLLEQNLLVLENEPQNRDAVDEIFRAAHTLKGGAATVQMMELSEFTHIVEDVFDGIRNNEVSVDEGLIDTLLNSIDVVKAMLEARSEGTVFDDDISEIENKLRSYLAAEAETAKSSGSQAGAPEAEQAAGTAPAVQAAAAGGLTEYEVLEMQEMVGDGEALYRISVTFDEDNPMNTVGGIQVFAAVKELGSVLKTIPEFDELYEDKFHPVVDYFVSSPASEEEVNSKLDIPDVVESANVELLTAEQKSTAARAEAAGAEAEPAEAETADQTEVEPAEEKPEEAGKPKQPEIKKSSMKSSVLRVDSSRIDNLLNLVSEAVINKATFNQLTSQFAEALSEFQNAEDKFQEKQRELFDSLPDYLERIHNGEPIKEIKREIYETYGDMFSLFEEFESILKGTIGNFRGTAQNLGRITTEMHERVLQIRMVPISQIFSRFPRLVRDLSKSLNKQIKLIIEGEETELDKSVIDDLLDPLIHCVRNSIDHGIESPEERRAAGKSEEGRVLLRASNEGNMINIEISDDGKGISVDDVRSKAIERGVIHPNKELSDIEAFNLIFEPGFSTAKEITNVSGRGVGLDVVKKQIEKLNGNATVWSEKGVGTRITVKIPLTLAIIQGLLVRVGKEIYAVPITSVLDSQRIKPSEINMIDNYEVFNLREDVISLLRLNRLFRVPTDENQEYNFVVIVGSSEGKKMGLMVDSLIGEEDVVIKPLKDKYTNSPGIAGATILGDGTVSLIIDVSQLLELGLKQEREQRRIREATIG